MTPLYYFAYGSNLPKARLLARISVAEVIATGHLVGHRLLFHMPSKDGSAKCDIHHTDRHTDHVWGVVYQIAASDKAVLDGYEGLGESYAEKTVCIATADGRHVDAFAYYAIQKTDNIHPYCWYREHVSRGATEHRFPEDYIAKIRAIKTIRDPDRQRRARELSVY